MLSYLQPRKKIHELKWLLRYECTYGQHVQKIGPPIRQGPGRSVGMSSNWVSLSWLLKFFGPLFHSLILKLWMRLRWQKRNWKSFPLFTQRSERRQTKLFWMPKIKRMKYFFLAAAETLCWKELVWIRSKIKRMPFFLTSSLNLEKNWKSFGNCNGLCAVGVRSVRKTRIQTYGC